MNYIEQIQKYYKDENSSEMSYRTPFQNFLESIFTKEDKYFVQHDQKAIDGNKPDFIILKNNIPVLYIEVKKVGEDLDKIEKSNQADRYFGYDNLIISDYINFRFYRYGKRYEEEISLGKLNKNEKSIEEGNKEEVLIKTILDFTNSHKEEIKSGRHLAEIMGGKALRIRENIFYMLSSQSDRFEELNKIKEVVKENLISNISDEDFADMYSQTLVYGLFASRYNDKTEDTFSRHEAIDLAPKTNPFLKKFFGHIAGESFPDRLRFIVDELCEVFSHADVHKLLTDFYGKEKDNKDPIIHFYEDFLKEYDSKKKMDMGVFYTPKPVVDFIIRGVDYILKNDFSLSDGLVSKEKIKLEKKIIDEKTGKDKKIEEEYHKVQILDIATGTGTFLNETISFIYNSFKEKGQLGGWDSYVNEHLLPRLHGFEIMMASYTIAHLKLGMTLEDTGIDTDKLNKRLGVYLTNTLEEAKDYSNQGTLFGFMDSIAEEAKSASKIKKEYPIMCVIGNPPYSISSQNKGEWILKLIDDYKKDLNEKKINIDDDYIKFIRFGQYMVDKNGGGILAYISNNSFISGVTHRKMRESLLKSFDKIYVLDLHGNARLKEVCPDGSKDQNVFDIMQGVSINIFVKSENKKEGLGKVYHRDLYGNRKDKFEFLFNTKFEDTKWKELEYFEPYYFFVPKDFGLKDEYDKGFKIDDFFMEYNSGIQTKRDDLAISFEKKEMDIKINDILNLNSLELKYKYKLPEDGRDWKIDWAKKDLKIDYQIINILYRPFDIRYVAYTRRSKGLIAYPREKINQYIVNKDNLSLLTCRNQDFNDICLITDKISDLRTYSNPGSLGTDYVFPLCLYKNQEKIPNLNKEIWGKINEEVGETTPENILDYIYAVLHSPKYREKYKEFLKIDFPRVPYPEGKEKFWNLVKIGEKLRGLHLMTDKSVNDFITTYSVSGDNLVDKISYKDGNVYINKDQYFGNVPEIAWNFYIGGYQPAQKYLKDRKGRILTSDEIEHYQKIIKVLVETDKIMRGIDKIR